MDYMSLNQYEAKMEEMKKAAELGLKEVLDHVKWARRIRSYVL